MQIAISYTYPEPVHLASQGTIEVAGELTCFHTARAIKDSGCIDTHYVFTESELVAQRTLESGCSIVPFKKLPQQYTPGVAREELLESIAEYILQERDDLHDPQADAELTPYRKLIRSCTLLHANLDLCLMKASSYENIIAMATSGKYLVYPVSRQTDTLFIGQEDNSLFPILHNSVQDYYAPDHRPRVYATPQLTFAETFSSKVSGRNNYFSYEVSEYENLVVNTPTRALLAAALLNNPEFY